MCLKENGGRGSWWIEPTLYTPTLNDKLFTALISGATLITTATQSLSAELLHRPEYLEKKQSTYPKIMGSNG